MTAVDLGQHARIAAAPLLLVLTVLLALAWAIRPWELHGGSWLDRLRVGEVIGNDDFWLTVRGVGGRRRRGLRDELRANLWEATLQVGSRQAVRAVGPTRRLAAEGTVEGTGPRWGQGLFAGLVSLELVVMLELLALTVRADAALAAKADRLDGGVTLIPGLHVTFEQRSAGGLSFGADLGPLPFAVAVLVFVLVARPWRLLTARVAGPA